MRQQLSALKSPCGECERSRPEWIGQRNANRPANRRIEQRPDPPAGPHNIAPRASTLLRRHHRAFDNWPQAKRKASRRRKLDTGCLFRIDRRIGIQIAVTIAINPVAGRKIARRQSNRQGRVPEWPCQGRHHRRRPRRAFPLAPTVIIDTGVTSDRYPAVVGISTSGKRGPLACP